MPTPPQPNFQNAPNLSPEPRRRRRRNRPQGQRGGRVGGALAQQPFQSQLGSYRRRRQDGARGPRGRPGGPRQAPYDPLAPLTGRLGQRELEAAAKLRYGEAEAQLAKERRISEQMMPRIGSWWEDYRQQVEQARQQGAAGYQQAAGAIGAQAAGMQAQDLSAAQQAAQQQQLQAVGRGQTLSPEVQQQATQAAAARASSAGQQAGLVGTLGANLNALLAGRGATATGIKARELGAEYGRRRGIESEARRLTGEKGEYKVAERGKQREAERRYALEQKAFGLDVAELTQEAQEAAARQREQERARRLRARENRRRARLTARGQNITVRGQNITAEQRAADRAARERAARERAASGGPAAFTPTQVRASRKDFRKALTAARKAQTKNYTYKKFVNEAPSSIDPLLVQVGWDVAHGGTTPARARRIKRDYGIKVKVKPASQGVGSWTDRIFD